LWESILPEELQRLPDQLARVDAVLDDTPFVPFFDPRMGRPSAPMETYLRLMCFTFRYRAREPPTPACEVLCFRPALPAAAGGGCGYPPLAVAFRCRWVAAPTTPPPLLAMVVVG
jgi:hypothetical protein